MLYKITVILLLWTSLLPAQPSPQAQPESPQTRTDLINMLHLQKAQTTLKDAEQLEQRLEREYAESQRLYDQSIISKKELDEALSAVRSARQALTQARIELDLTKLGFLDNATHITVLEAKKYYDPNGRRMLDLVLKNTSNLAQAEAALTRNNEDLSSWQTPQAVRGLLNIENIFVSVVDEQASIAKPYEQVVGQLPYNGQVRLSFTLLTDVQQAGIRLQYLDTDHIERVTLEKESLQSRPTLVASQLSVEGALGSDITYDLNLEMLVTDERIFSLAVTNLPPQFNGSFMQGAARIMSVRFSEEVSKHALSLNVSVPQKLDLAMIDQPIDFQAWVVTTAQLEALNPLKRENAPDPIPMAHLADLQGARVDLTLTPKGSGRLEILINNLYMEIKPQQAVDLSADLHNDGTLTLFNLVPEISPPLGWTAQVEPNRLDKLLPNEKHKLHIHLQPGSDIGVGEYETLLQGHGQSGSEAIEAVEKRLKVRINAQTNVTATLLLVAGLVMLIVGIVVFGVKLSRR